MEEASATEDALYAIRDQLIRLQKELPTLRETLDQAIRSLVSEKHVQLFSAPDWQAVYYDKGNEDIRACRLVAFSLTPHGEVLPLVYAPDGHIKPAGEVSGYVGLVEPGVAPEKRDFAETIDRLKAEGLASEE